MPHVIVWDLETVPDLKALHPPMVSTARPTMKSERSWARNFRNTSTIRSFVSVLWLPIGRIEHWVVDALGAAHVGERSERELIAAFVDKIAQLKPQLVTFNGSSFDLPVLRYRAMVTKYRLPGLSARRYFHRYTDDAVDLCDVLSSFSPGAKASLHELCRVMGLPGKPDAINGSEVDQLFS